ncbi:MAG: hypothetical protein ACI4F2_08435 [Acutalibacteraceae bacterium]
MKYSLQENALSSLSIAIEKFKQVYYFNGEDTETVFDENMKICAIFLENSVELLLKSILVLNDPISIYCDSDSKKIQEALEKVDENNKLEDILISSGNFRTITYVEAIDKICSDVCKSKKVKNILEKLGRIRNALTHFGVIGDDNEYIISFLNVFDVIYNYLYPEIVNIQEISDYFTSDDLFVNTVHGVKPLFDENFKYNNIVDFLDELMEVSKNWCYQARVNNSDYKMGNFIKLFEELLGSGNFQKMFSYYDAYIKINSCDSQINDYDFEIGNKNGVWDILTAVYSPYYNSSCFIGEYGNIFFRIEHSTDTIFIYKKDIILPDVSKPEFEDYEWKEHVDKGVCVSYKLTKRNIKLAFENILINMNSNKV